MESQPIGWELGNAPKQSITEVLQNPHGTSLTLPELSAFDLSTNATPLAPRPALLDINHFEDYLRRYAPLHAAFVREKKRLDASASAPPQQTSIPELYFSPDFSVASNPHLVNVQPSSNNDPLLESQVNQLRESLAAQRTSLEEKLRETLNHQSKPISAALENSRVLREELASTAEALRLARSKAAELVPVVVDGLQLIRAVVCVQENARTVRSALGLLQYVVKAPNDVADLIRTGEYEGAIRVVGEAKEALGSEELVRVAALAPVRGKLARAVESIDAALRDEFREALRVGEGQEETLAYVVRLVDSMGRLSLLQGVFLKEIRVEVSKELEQAESTGAACRVVRAGAKKALMIVHIIHGGESDGKTKPEERSDLKELREEMESMLSSVMDRFLGSFSMSSATATRPLGANTGFVVITDANELTEQTCFDEFKGALRFGEELRVFEVMAAELDGIFSFEKRNSSLRAKISERQIAFLSAFHKAHMDVLTGAVRSDKWQEVKVPQGASRLLAAVLDDADENVNSHHNDQSNATKITYANDGQQGDVADGVVIPRGDVFRMVACGVRYLRSLCAYTLLTEKSPNLAQEVARRGTELSRLFNSLIGRSILGAQALQWSGLRSITARHLALASRTIAMAVVLAGRANRSFENAIPKSQIDVILPLIQKSEKDLGDHHEQLLAKILTIMMDRLEAHEEVLRSLPWDKAQEMQRFDVPSTYITTLVKEAIVLHRILWSILPTIEVCNIFQHVCAAYGSHLTDVYSSLDGRKKWIRSRVAEDVSCLHERLHILEVFKANPAAIKPISLLYARFAKEYNQEKDKQDSKEMGLFSGRTFIQKAQEVASQYVSPSTSEPQQDEVKAEKVVDDSKGERNIRSVGDGTMENQKKKSTTEPDSNELREQPGASGTKSEAPQKKAEAPKKETQRNDCDLQQESDKESGLTQLNADITATSNGGMSVVSGNGVAVEQTAAENGHDEEVPSGVDPSEEAFEEELKRVLGVDTDSGQKSSNEIGERLQRPLSEPSIQPQGEERIESVKVLEGDLLDLDESS